MIHSWGQYIQYLAKYTLLAFAAQLSVDVLYTDMETCLLDFVKLTCETHFRWISGSCDHSWLGLGYFVCGLMLQWLANISMNSLVEEWGEVLVSICQLWFSKGHFLGPQNPFPKLLKHSEPGPDVSRQRLLIASTGWTCRDRWEIRDARHMTCHSWHGTWEIEVFVPREFYSDQSRPSVMLVRSAKLVGPGSDFMLPKKNTQHLQGPNQILITIKRHFNTTFSIIFHLSCLQLWVCYLMLSVCTASVTCDFPTFKQGTHAASTRWRSWPRGCWGFPSCQPILVAWPQLAIAVKSLAIEYCCAFPGIIRSFKIPNWSSIPHSFRASMSMRNRKTLKIQLNWTNMISSIFSVPEVYSVCSFVPVLPRYQKASCRPEVCATSWNLAVLATCHRYPSFGLTTRKSEGPWSWAFSIQTAELYGLKSSC